MDPMPLRSKKNMDPMDLNIEEVCTSLQNFYFRMAFMDLNSSRSPSGSQANNSYVTHFFVSLLPVRDILQLFVYCTCAENECPVAFMSKQDTQAGLQ